MNINTTKWHNYIINQVDRLALEKEKGPKQAGANLLAMGTGTTSLMTQIVKFCLVQPIGLAGRAYADLSGFYWEESYQFLPTLESWGDTALKIVKLAVGILLSAAAVVASFWTSELSKYNAQFQKDPLPAEVVTPAPLKPLPAPILAAPPLPPVVEATPLLPSPPRGHIVIYPAPAVPPPVAERVLIHPVPVVPTSVVKPVENVPPVLDEFEEIKRESESAYEKAKEARSRMKRAAYYVHSPSNETQLFVVHEARLALYSVRDAVERADSAVCAAKEKKAHDLIEFAENISDKVEEKLDKMKVQAWQIIEFLNRNAHHPNHDLIQAINALRFA